MGTLDGALRQATRAVVNTLGTEITITHRAAGKYNTTTGKGQDHLVTCTVHGVPTNERHTQEDGDRRRKVSYLVADVDQLREVKTGDKACLSDGKTLQVVEVRPQQATDERAALVLVLAGPV